MLHAEMVAKGVQPWPSTSIPHPAITDTTSAPHQSKAWRLSDLPDKGRGSVDENIGKALKRKTPMQTGGTPQETGGDVGMRAMPNTADADDHGHRKHN